MKRLHQEIETVLDHDPKVAGVLEFPELGVMTVAVLRAELGDLARFTRMDQVVAYVGLDLEVKQSGKYKGQTGYHTPSNLGKQHLATGQTAGEGYVFVGPYDLVVVRIFCQLSAGLDKFDGFCSVRNQLHMLQ